MIKNKAESYHRVYLVHARSTPFIDRVNKLWEMFEMPCHLCCHNHVDYSLTDCAKCIPIKAKKKTVDEKTVAVYSVTRWTIWTKGHCCTNISTSCEECQCLPCDRYSAIVGTPPKYPHQTLAFPLLPHLVRSTAVFPTLRIHCQCWYITQGSPPYHQNFANFHWHII